MVWLCVSDVVEGPLDSHPLSDHMPSCAQRSKGKQWCSSGPFAGGIFKLDSFINAFLWEFAGRSAFDCLFCYVFSWVFWSNICVYPPPLWLLGNTCVERVVASRFWGHSCSGAFSLMVADVPETFKDQFCVVAGVTHQGPGWRWSVQNFQIETEKLVCGGKEKWAKEQSSHRKKNVSFSYCFVSVVDGGHSLNLLWESFHDVHHQIICCTLYTYAMLCVHCISATPEGKKKQNKDARGFPVMRALCCWTLTCDELKDLGQYLSRTKASGIRKTEFRWSSMSDFTDY